MDDNSTMRGIMKRSARVFYNVKFIGGGVHVREAFIRSLMVGGHRSISLTGMLIQGQVSSTNFFFASIERFTHGRCKS